MKNALKSFEPEKSAGPDELKPRILQNLGPKAIELVTDIYRQSIKKGASQPRFYIWKLSLYPKTNRTNPVQKVTVPLHFLVFSLKG